MWRNAAGLFNVSQHDVISLGTSLNIFIVCSRLTRTPSFSVVIGLAFNRLQVICFFLNRRRPKRLYAFSRGFPPRSIRTAYLRSIRYTPFFADILSSRLLYKSPIMIRSKPTEAQNTTDVEPRNFDGLWSCHFCFSAFQRYDHLKRHVATRT